VLGGSKAAFILAVLGRLPKIRFCSPADSSCSSFRPRAITPLLSVAPVDYHFRYLLLIGEKERLDVMKCKLPAP